MYRSSPARPPRRVDPGGGPGYRPSRMAGALLWCAAVEPDLLPRIERHRYLTLGMFVVLVALLAGMSFALVVPATVEGLSPVLVGVAAAVWAVVVFALDRAIVAEPTYDDLRRSESDDRSPHWRRLGPVLSRSALRGGTYLVRLLVAVLVAWLIGEALLLALFAGEIGRELNRRHGAEFAVEAQRIADGTDAEIARLRTELVENNDRIAQAERRAVEARERVGVEERGGAGSSGVPGRADNYRVELAAAQEAERAAQEVLAAVRRQDTVLQQRITELAAAKTAQINGSPEAIDASPVLRAAYAKIFANNGLAEREAALADYLDRHADRPTVVALPWVLRLLLLAVDLMPLLLKLGNGQTVYGLRVRELASKVRNQDRAEVDPTGPAAGLARLSADIDRQVARQNEIDRASRLLGHPYRPPDPPACDGPGSGARPPS